MGTSYPGHAVLEETLTVLKFIHIGTTSFSVTEIKNNTYFNGPLIVWYAILLGKTLIVWYAILLGEILIV